MCSLAKILSSSTTDAERQQATSTVHRGEGPKEENEIQSKDHQIENLKYLIRKYINEVQSKKEELRLKTQEIEELKSLLKGHAQKWEKIKFEAHEHVSNDFYNYYNWIEFNLPKELKQKIDRIEIWKHFCNIYQTCFSRCREAIHSVFKESLVSLTELSEKEEGKGQTDWNRQKEIENMKTAYEYLLKQCASKLHEVDLNSIAEEIIISSNIDERISKDILREQTRKAVKICWRMQTVSPPMFLCQPKLFNEDWHTIHSRTWYNKEDELVYYKPVLMNSAGGTVACKGLVGNPVEQTAAVNVCDTQEKSLTSSDVGNTEVTHCSSCNKKMDACTNLQLTGGLCDNCYHINTICNKCRKQLRPTDTHWYGGKVWHKDCFPVRYWSRYSSCTCMCQCPINEQVW